MFHVGNYIRRSVAELKTRTTQIEGIEDPRAEIKILNLVQSINYLTEQMIFTHGVAVDGVSVGVGAGGVVGDSAMIGVLGEGIASGTAYTPLAAYVAVDKLLELTWGNVLMTRAYNNGAVIFNPARDDLGLDVKVLHPDEPLKVEVHNVGLGVDSIWFEIAGKNYYNPDLVLPLEKIFSRHYSAIVIPSLRMRLAYYEAVFNPKAGCTYFQARTERQNISYVITIWRKLWMS